jgi:hypothetical protein
MTITKPGKGWESPESLIHQRERQGHSSGVDEHSSPSPIPLHVQAFFPRHRYAMEALPAELLALILEWNVRMCRGDKNTLIELRFVCKAFDAILKPYVFKTVQLEFSKFLRHEPTSSTTHLERVGGLCESMYLDMMIIRDEGAFIDYEIRNSLVIYFLNPLLMAVAQSSELCLLNLLQGWMANGPQRKSLDSRRCLKA